MTIEERVERLEAMVFASRAWDTERIKSLMARRGWGTVSARTDRAGSYGVRRDGCRWGSICSRAWS